MYLFLISVLQLARQPLYFRETNPQPRKHTLWQATADFTDGQSSKHRYILSLFSSDMWMFAQLLTIEKFDGFIIHLSYITILKYC